MSNCDPHEPFAGCNPFGALKAYEIDGIIAAGMGDSVLQAMNLCGHRVFEAQSEHLIENMELFLEKKLPESEIQNSAAAGRCSDGEEDTNDSGSGGCDHDHEH